MPRRTDRRSDLSQARLPSTGTGLSPCRPRLSRGLRPHLRQRTPHGVISTLLESGLRVRNPVAATAQPVFHLEPTRSTETPPPTGFHEEPARRCSDHDTHQGVTPWTL